MQTEASPDGHLNLLYARVHDTRSEGAASTTSENAFAPQTVGTAERSLFGAREVVPNDDDEVPKQQGQGGTDIKQKELHKSPKSLSRFWQRSVVAGGRTHSHLARHIT